MAHGENAKNVSEANDQLYSSQWNQSRDEGCCGAGPTVASKMKTVTKDKALEPAETTTTSINRNPRQIYIHHRSALDKHPVTITPSKVTKYLHPRSIHKLEQAENKQCFR